MNLHTRGVALAAAVGLVLAAAGCGGGASTSTTGQAGASAGVNPNGPEVSPSGDIPDNQAYVAYSPAGGGYSVKVPEGWSRTSAGGATTFTDKLNSIRMEAVPARSTPPKPAGATVSAVTRTAGPAVRISYLADSPADPVTGKTHRNAVERYVFVHKAKAIVLTLTGPKGADNVDPWKIVTNSLRFTA
jgi:hypothetical protein